MLGFVPQPNLQKFMFKGGIMNNKANQIEPIPNEFASYEEAAEFWDNHDTTDYLEYFETVAVETEFRGFNYKKKNTCRGKAFGR